MAWSRHCRARTSACGMRRVRASQAYRRARPACPLPSEGSRSPGTAVIDVMDSAMASTACRACWAAVPDKVGRQQLAAVAASGFAITSGPTPLTRTQESRRRVQNRLALRRSLLPRRAAVSSCGGNRVVRPEMGIRQPTWHVRCLIPSSRDCPANPWYAFGLPAARVTRSGQEQPDALVFGQLFGPPFGGVLLPLCAPPTIWDRSFSSSVRRVSFDRVSFFFMNFPLETVLPTRGTRSGYRQPVLRVRVRSSPTPWCSGSCSVRRSAGCCCHSARHRRSGTGPSRRASAGSPSTGSASCPSRTPSPLRDAGGTVARRFDVRAPSERRRFYRHDPADKESHNLRSGTTLAHLAII